MTRRCGDCTLCCKLLPVRELGKGANERCRFQSHKGCRVYHQPRKGFPVSCDLWNCRWLVDPETTKLRRPDRSHYVVDIMPDLVRVDNNNTGESQEISVVVVWVDRAFPDAWRDPELLAIAEKNGTPLLIRYSATEGFGAFPPSVTGESEWKTSTQHTVEPSISGSRLLDHIRAGWTE